MGEAEKLYNVRAANRVFAERLSARGDWGAVSGPLHRQTQAGGGTGLASPGIGSSTSP